MFFFWGPRARSWSRAGDAELQIKFPCPERARLANRVSFQQKVMQQKGVAETSNKISEVGGGSDAQLERALAP